MKITVEHVRYKVKSVGLALGHLFLCYRVMCTIHIDMDEHTTKWNLTVKKKRFGKASRDLALALTEKLTTKGKKSNTR